MSTKRKSADLAGFFAFGVPAAVKIKWKRRTGERIVSEVIKGERRILEGLMFGERVN
ncbi:hypothetical protein [Aneurinibacillus sp. REN35]|uniref:hypothetical protein n=1 Tax=Aneurinibacillus sp. REN35 TaxID=3237286 RepID=UPI0035283B8D